MSGKGRGPFGATSGGDWTAHGGGLEPVDPKPDRANEGKVGRPRSGRALTPMVVTGARHLDGGPVEQWLGALHAEEIEFLRLVARGYDEEDAAQLVGQPRESGRALTHRLLATKAGAAFVRQQQQHIVAGKLTGLTFRALEDVLLHGDDRSRVAAGRTVLEAGAWFGKRADETVAAMRSAGLDPAVMSAEELEEAARRTHAQIAEARELLATLRDGARVIDAVAEEADASPADDAAPDAAPWD